MKLKEKREAAGLRQSELAEACGCDSGMISRLENYRCLPVPKMLEAMLGVLACSVEDIYSDEEIELKGIIGKAEEESKETALTVKEVRTSRDFTEYKLTVRLPREARGELARILPKLGYRSISHWVSCCYIRLLAREKKKESLATNKTLVK